MLLDTSIKSWEMFSSLVKKAKEAGTIWYSPKQARPYKVAEVLPDKIIIERDGGENSEFGIRGYQFFLEHFNKNNGVYNRKSYNGHVAKMSAIVYFHPLLQWANNNDSIIVNNTALSGTYEYRDFGTPPNDDINDLQFFARRVRKGQTMFRNALLVNYNKRCCISGSVVIEVLDACHIEPHSISGINQIENGLLLRTDIHSLFDLNLILINPDDYKIHVHPSLLNSEYKCYNGHTISGTTLPDRNYLESKWNQKSW